MKVNPLLNELSRGIWAMSFEGLGTYGPLAHKLMSGEKIELNSPTAEPKALISFIDQNMNRVVADESGRVPQGTVAVVDMIGAIIKYGDWCTYGADEIVGALRAADNNPNIIATILNVDGPGGSVSAVAPFVEFGLTKKKPVVGLFDQCCSAHLYAMLSCVDHVMAGNSISAAIGSVGVVLSWMDNRKYLETLGYVFHEVYPEESANKNQAFQLAMKGDYDLIKSEMLSPIAIKFQDAVKAARPNLDLRIPGLITGKVFGAEAALDAKLIDSIGSLRAAIEMATMLAEMNSVYKN